MMQTPYRNSGVVALGKIRRLGFNFASMTRSPKQMEEGDAEITLHRHFRS
jgi:hypothetical protein